MIYRQLIHILFLALLFLSGAMGLTEAPPYSALDKNGEFFLKYYDRYQELLKIDINKDEKWSAPIPDWLSDICEHHDIGQICEYKSLNPKRLQELAEIIRLAYYNTLCGGAVEMALSVALADPENSQAVLDDTIKTFDEELRFYRLTKNLHEKKYWEELLRELQVEKQLDIELKGSPFHFEYLTNGSKHAVRVKNSDGKIVFSDGPRWISYRHDPDLRELTTSMTTTWTEPQYRGFGMYQYALHFYMQELNLEKSYLYTENEETLEFIYRMKKNIYEEDTRQLLLKVPGLRTYLKDVGISVDKVEEGHRRHLRIAETALGFLSLQGRTRLNLEMTFLIDDEDHAIVHSQTMDSRDAMKIKKAMKKFEAKLEAAIQTDKESLIRSVLPKSYLKKYNTPQKSAAVPLEGTSTDNCSKLLTPSAA